MAEAQSDPPLLSNEQLAAIFHEIGDMLEVKGELVFKTVAYHRAADAIGHYPVEIARAYRAGNVPRIPGVGQAISDKLAELSRTGRLAFHERLAAEIPAGLVGLLQVPGVGPKTVRLLRDALGIDGIDALRRAAQAGQIRTVKGLSDKTEASILAGIAALETRSDRMLLGTAEALVERLVAVLAEVPGVSRIEPAGSYRRRRETIGDLDLLAETSDPAALVERFVAMPGVERVLGAGSAKASVSLAGGPQVDLMLMPPGEAGTYLVHFTGSKDHNIRLRGLARERGWSLSEKGYLRVDPDGVALAPADLRTFPTEVQAYAFLDLPFIEPELREDRGEIEAAQAGRLPTLVSLADLRGDLHSHSDWSDGVHSIEQMAEAARRRGHAYQVLTDHTRSLGIANGLSPERVHLQRAVLAELNQRFAREEAAGTAPSETPAEGFRLLHGCELEIRSDATLDYPDDLLGRYDVVVASVHVGRGQPREQLTRRVLAAIRSPHVDVIAHPAGRKVQGRPDLDLDWDAIFAEAARTGTALEMNGSDHRLDLTDQRARRAVGLGCLLALDSDAHRIEEFHHLGWAVSQARRAWVESRVVLNTRSRADLLAWVGAKAERLAASP
ncbi:MAG: DNA polymerase/3'-5' exonuclease PolX [Candidatus Limnocylindrales bacterium]